MYLCIVYAMSQNCVLYSTVQHTLNAYSMFELIVQRLKIYWRYCNLAFNLNRQKPILYKEICTHLPIATLQLLIAFFEMQLYSTA